MYEQVATGVNGQPDQKNRCLFLDGIMMSCLHDEKTYHETLIHPAMIASPNPRRVAVLGGGEGASIRELLKYSSVEKAYMLELDNDVVDLCKRNLPTMSDGAYSNPRTDLRIGDAFDFFASPEGEEGVHVRDVVRRATSLLFAPRIRTISLRSPSRVVCLFAPCNS